MSITYKQIFELIVRFIAIALSIGINMRRILKSNIAIDDTLFVLSIIFGIIFGIAWNSNIKSQIG
jgi:Na+/glutamate symporter